MGRFSLGCLIAPAALFAAVAPAHAAISLMSGPSVFSQMSSPALDISSTADLGRTMARASNRASRVVGHSILFDAPGLDSDAADLVADVADVTAQAFENSALVLNGREKTIAIRRVLFVEGGKPDARLEGDVLRISFSTGMGAAGRPTPERIFHLLATQAPT